MTTQPPASTELVETVDRIAVKLGVTRIVLVGAAEPTFFGGLLGRAAIVGIDIPARIAAAREIAPREDWRSWEPRSTEWPAKDVGTADLIVVGVDAMLAQAGIENLRRVLREAPAAIIVGNCGRPGLDLLREFLRVVEGAGLRVESAGLIGRHRGARDYPVTVVSDGHDQRVRALLRGGLNSLAFDTSIDVFAGDSPRARILVASYEVVGPTRTGGIGTANTSLATSLADAGHDVTLLFTGSESDDVRGRVLAWTDFYERKGIRFESLGRLDGWHEASPHFNVSQSYELYRWLCANEPYDIVHVPECQGHGFFAQQAKRYGHRFPTTTFVVGIHSTTRWCAEANRQSITRLEQLIDDELERRSVELADVVISPSAYLLDHVRRRGWSVPERSFVQQYIVPSVAADVVPRTSLTRPNEIVFFGRIETRKGVEIFCDAIDQLAVVESHRHLTITFLGKSGWVGVERGEAYVNRRAESWPWPHSVLTDKDQHDAIGYLRSASCIAVMPSLVDNLPNTVIESLSLGIPFIASRSGGTAELVDASDLEHSTFDPFDGAQTGTDWVDGPDSRWEVTGDDLVSKLSSALSIGQRVARFAVEPDACRALHLAWNAGEAARAQRGRRFQPTSAPFPPPMALAVAADARDIDEALRTIEGVHRVGIEAEGVGVLMGRFSGAAATSLERFASLCQDIGWLVVNQPAVHLGRARNAVLGATTSPIVVFLQPGAVPLPALALELAHAEQGDAIGFTFVAKRPPTLEGEARFFIPISGPAVAGLRYDGFSVGGYAVRRRPVEAAGGYAGDASGLDADTELIARLLLGGAIVAHINEPMIRIESESLDRELASRVARATGYREPGDPGSLSIERTFRSALPESIVDVVGLLRAAPDPAWASGLVASAGHLELLKNSRAVRAATRVRRLQARVSSVLKS